MKALRFHGPGDLRVEEVPRPEPGPSDVLVEVEVALTDGTDLKTFQRGHPRILDRLPSPFGHEFCGVDVVTGRRVVAANSAPCGHCGACQAGRETLCQRLEFLTGAYAEYLLVPEPIAAVNLHPVPDRLASESLPCWSRSPAACTGSSARRCSRGASWQCSVPGRSASCSAPAWPTPAAGR